MRNTKRRPAGKAAPKQPWPLKRWHVAAGFAIAFAAAVLAYGPALNGPFVFDDIYLPFFSPRFAEQPLLAAIRGVRPILMLSFWINNRLAGAEPYLYHLTNLFLHVLNSLMVFLIARRLTGWCGTEPPRRELAAALAAGVFLLHPGQTEAVAYVASRSENLSAFFFFAAILVFVYRKTATVSWLTAAGILALYAGAASTKEHTVVLPVVLLMLDYYWNPGHSFGGIRRNWRLYAPIAIGAAAGAWYVLDVLRNSVSAGFRLEGLPWNHYFYTQWRALWIYFRIFLFPAGQNADYDYPIVRSPFDPWAAAGLAGLLALIVAAVYWRKRFPLASFGVLCALALFAPTSSVAPIADAVAERRLYLPMLGLALLPAEFFRTWRARPAAAAGTAAALLALLGVVTYQRSQVWSSERALWEDVVAKSPWNGRARIHLGVAYFKEGRCQEAADQYGEASRLGKPDRRAFINWAAALDCLNRPTEAVEKLRQSIALQPSADAWSQMAMILGKQGDTAGAMAAVHEALRLNPRDDMAYFYRGNLKSLAGDQAGAAEDYRRAIEINPDNEQAQRGLARVLSVPKGI